jgi:hypothetical protein
MMGNAEERRSIAPCFREKFNDSAHRFRENSTDLAPCFRENGLRFYPLYDII